MKPLVILIDSGVNTAHPHLKNHPPIQKIGLVGHDGRLLLGQEEPDRLGHGTAAAAAILDLAPGISLGSLQVFLAEPRCPFEHILTALHQALALKPRLINLSLGTSDRSWTRALRARLQVCRKKEIRLVAPATFAGRPSLPGALKESLGALPDPNLPREAPRPVKAGDESLWFASPFPRSLPGLPPSANLKGASMAAANLTGFLAARLQPPRTGGQA